MALIGFGAGGSGGLLKSRSAASWAALRMSMPVEEEEEEEGSEVFGGGFRRLSMGYEEEEEEEDGAGSISFGFTSVLGGGA